MNTFIEAIKCNKINSEDELKKIFRELALKTHPDITKTESSSDIFIKMYQEYLDALNYLNSESIDENTTPVLYERQACLTIFAALVSGNFPVDKSVKEKSKIYLERLETLIKLYALNPDTEYKDFKKVEEEFYIVRRDDTVLNPLYGKIKFICYNICTYYYNPKSFTKYGVLNTYKEIKSVLIERNLLHLHCFIQWLLRELLEETL